MQCGLAAQMLVPVISLAFLIVIASTAIYTPLLLYVFDLRRSDGSGSMGPCSPL